MAIVQLFQGNSNTYMSEMLNLDPPMIAKNVRFLPYSAGPRTVCMRVELYGCSWTGLSLLFVSPSATHSGSRWMFSAEFLCLFVCQHDNF